MKLFYSKDYVASAEAFDTTRKAGWIARSLRSDSVEGVELCEPNPLNYDDLMEVPSHCIINTGSIKIIFI